MTKKNDRTVNHATHSRNSSAANRAEADGTVVSLQDRSYATLWFLALAAGMFVAIIWSYWPDLVTLVHAWNTESDYSHGYLVVPICLFVLWVRRDQLPKQLNGFHMGGLLLIVLSVAWRIAAERFFIPEVATWSLIPLIAGCCWLLFGWRFFVWSAPAIAFLFFMMKLPFRAETLLGTPLRRISCHLGSWILQCLGQPAIPEWTTINLGGEQLEVAQACSGLRMFIGVFALVSAYLILTPRPWWQKLMLFLAIAPITVLANSIRIAITGMVYQLVSSDFGRTFAHDVAGWFVIPLAAIFFACGLWYLDRAFIPVSRATPTGLPSGHAV